MTIKEKVQKYTPELLQNLKDLVSFPSVYQKDDKTPFGQANKECLEFALELGRKLGFKAVNLDDYAGYIEMGQGDEVIGIVGHLDVVPVSDTWKTNPFEMTLIDDKYYGRGTSDDKGGVVCGLMAMKILSEIQPNLNKRIRLIMGCNEESGSACLRYYVSKEGHVDCGFTPDGNFPVVFGEKGMIHGTLKGTTQKIYDIKGGTAANAVCAKVEIVLEKDCFNEETFSTFIIDNGLTYSLEKTVDNWTLTVMGKAAHASLPHEGVNAMSYAMEGLFISGINDSFVDVYHKLIGTSYNGEGLGVKLSDEYGDLTLNIGVINKKEDTIYASIDIRFPVTMTHQSIVETINNTGKDTVEKVNGIDPLFFPLESPMIKAMLDAYYEVTNSDLKPMTIGGGTYARTMNNIVAFGCDTQEYNWHIHDDDEFVTLKSLQIQTEVYTKALINLLKI